MEPETIHDSQWCYQVQKFDLVSGATAMQYSSCHSCFVKKVTLLGVSVLAISLENFLGQQ